MALRKGDLLIYVNKEHPVGHGSLAIAIRNEYKDEECDKTYRGIDVDWITGHPSVTEFTDFNISCFEKIGHIRVARNKS